MRRPSRPTSGLRRLHQPLIAAVNCPAIGGGLWMASKGIHARLDHLAIRTTSKMTQVRTEMFGLGNQVQSLTMEVRKLRKQITAMQSAAAAAAADKKR